MIINSIIIEINTITSTTSYISLIKYIGPKAINFNKTSINNIIDIIKFIISQISIVKSPIFKINILGYGY